jgi:hypothetical protein
MPRNQEKIDLNNDKEKKESDFFSDLIHSEYSRNYMPSNNLNNYYKTVVKKSDIVDLNKSIEHILTNLRGKFYGGGEDYLSTLKNNFRDEKLVLVLGAGVSMGFGLPNWEILLQKLMVMSINSKDDSSTNLSALFSKIFNPSPLIAGRYLQKHFESQKKLFEEEVRSILYKEIDREVQSPLMDQIINFCISPGKSPNLNSIITYNFDDILEERLKALPIDLPFKAIFGNSEDIEAGELPIYHVHGYLPEKGDLAENNLITFGENFYHKQYMDIYSWNNIVQINKFRDYNCLFVGVSLTDPNTRRLLDIANQQRTESKGFHYCFKLKQDADFVKDKLEFLMSQTDNVISENIEDIDMQSTVESLIALFESFEEKDLLSLGIKTIWVKNYSEIPLKLDEIRRLSK